MSDIVRFGVSLSRKLLENFDRNITRKGYTSRSEALRDLIREHLVDFEWKEGKKETVGTITLVYNHKTRELGEKLTHIQHQYVNLIISSTHIHLDKYNCLEVLILKGTGKKITAIADKLISTKGVKHGKLTMTTTGKELA
ncbi:nickel-responsive transcriptional regulator NikR [candidate division WOR-3 bacterium]|nr:nickel-responsive transcriptional regulator NikR [candidate division WOR-3 bacterium]